MYGTALPNRTFILFVLFPFGNFYIATDATQIWTENPKFTFTAVGHGKPIFSELFPTAFTI
jgi:hypothetical protein